MNIDRFDQIVQYCGSQLLQVQILLRLADELIYILRLIFLLLNFFFQNMPYDHDRIDEIVDLILETVCTKRRTIRIAGDDYPAELVKSKFMKLDSEHIRFVLDCMRENTTKIRNIKQYLSPTTWQAAHWLRESPGLATRTIILATRAKACKANIRRIFYGTENRSIGI